MNRDAKSNAAGPSPGPLAELVQVLAEIAVDDYLRELSELSEIEADNGRIGEARE